MIKQELEVPKDSIWNQLPDQQFLDLYHKFKNIQVLKPGPVQWMEGTQGKISFRHATTNYPDISWTEFNVNDKIPKRIAFFVVQGIEGAFEDKKAKERVW